MTRSSLIASLLLAAACADPSVVEVTMTVREGVPDIDNLSVIVESGADRQEARFEVAGRSFPLTFTVTPDGREGELDVVIFARDSLGTTIGEARSSATIAGGEAVSLNVRIEPADFLVNSVTDGAQQTAFRPGRNGRALAASADGFVVTFVNDCIVGSACDVFLRRFDALGEPQPLAGSVAELAVNAADEPRVSVPAVAVNGAGEIGIVWETDDAIRYSRIDGGGALATTDIKVSADTVENPEDPAIVGVTGGFLVSWFQESDNPVPAGIQRALVSSTAGALTTLRDEGSARSPAMAGDDTLIATAWSESDSLVAEVSPPNGNGTDNVVATFSGEFIGAPQVAAVAGGYVVSYGRQSDNASRGQMLTRLDAAGARVRDVVIAETSARATDRPSIAVDDENRVAVAWTACVGEGEPDGDGCAIMLALYDSDLSPLTEPKVVNTTTIDDQFEPAVVATTIGFAVVWTDNSGALPDSSIAVRARIVYVDTLL